MYLTVNERICLEYVWVALVFVWCFALFQDVSEWGQIVEIPIIIDKPSGFNQWHFVLGHTDSLCHSYTLLVFGYNTSLVVLNVNLEDVAILVVVASPTWFLFLAPHLDNPASSRLAREQKVVILQTAISETLCIRGNVFLFSSPLVDFTEFAVFLGRCGELLTQLPK